jgi:hypothetical protein
MRIFVTGFIQVYFVAINTYFLAHSFYLGVFMAAFLISMIWSYNVKRVAFGSTRVRIIYSFGAALGAVAGLGTSEIILKYL